MMVMLQTSSTALTALLGSLPAIIAPAQQPPQPITLPSSVGDFQVSAQQLATAIAYAALRGRIETWTNLPADWDGRDGESLGIEAASTAKDVLRHLESSGVGPPTPYIAGDGEVGFRWSTDRGFASISMLADGHVVGLVRGAAGPPFRVDEPHELAPIGELVRQVAMVA